MGQLIARLQTFAADLRVVTPGFDEAAYDDVGTVEIVYLDFSRPLGGNHCGEWEERADGTPAVVINF
ncbi:MAG: hypothetical protein ACYDCI_00410 [Candidatus Limnocylindrales bacterium]